MKIPLLKTFLALAILVLALNARAAAPVVVAVGANAQSLTTPANVAVDSEGRAYVTDASAGCVTVFDAFGRLVERRSGFATPLGIAVDAAGRIYVGESQPGSVKIFNAQWQLLGALGSGDGEFLQPNDIALDPAGSNTVFVCDSRANLIKVYQDGAFAFSFGGGGQANGLFDFPAGVCVSAAGEVFVMDQGNDRVQVFDLAGTYLRRIKFAGMTSLSGRKQDVLLDGAGRLYVADTFQGIVKVYDAASGAYLADIGTFGTATGQLRLPCGLALDGFSRLHVVSMNNARVEIFGVDDFIHFAVKPPGQLIGTGIPVTFSVVTGGAGQSTFQWRRGTNDLVGATNALFALNNPSLGDAGDYSVVITGASNTVVSPTTSLSLFTSPSIVSSPTNRVVVQGEPVRFDVVATGDGLTLQWQRNGFDVAGATGATLLLDSAQVADAGDYIAVVSNAVGVVVSEPARLTVLVPPSVTSDPVSQTVTEGGTAAFEILAQGDLISYQWKFNGTDIIGANSSKLELAAVQTNWSGEYTAVVTSPAGSASSGAATLTVTPPPAPPQIGTFTLLSDGNVRFTVTGNAGNYSIVASTNLTDWAELTNTVSAGGAFDFTDLQATNETRRFYRVHFWP